jgi:hypothetical protein
MLDQSIDLANKREIDSKRRVYDSRTLPWKELKSIRHRCLCFIGITYRYLTDARPIPYFPRYMITKEGFVLSFAGNIAAKSWKAGEFVNLNKNGESFRYLVSDVISETFGD